MNKKLKSGLSREFFDYSGNSKNSLSKNFTKKLMLSAFAATTALVPCYEAGATTPINLNHNKGGGAITLDANAAGGGNTDQVVAHDDIQLTHVPTKALTVGTATAIGGIDANNLDLSGAGALQIIGANANLKLGAIKNYHKGDIKFKFGGDKTLELTGQYFDGANTLDNPSYEGLTEIDVDNKDAEILFSTAPSKVYFKTVDKNVAGNNKRVSLKVNDGTEHSWTLQQAETVKTIDLKQDDKSKFTVKGYDFTATAGVDFSGKTSTFEYVNNTANPTTLTVAAFTTAANDEGNVVIGSTGGGTVNVASDIKGSAGGGGGPLKSVKFNTDKKGKIIVNDGKVTNIGDGGGEFTGDGSLTFGDKQGGTASFDLTGANFKVGAGKLKFKGAVTAAGNEALHFVDDGEIIFNPQGGNKNATIAITVAKDGQGTVTFNNSDNVSDNVTEDIGAQGKKVKKLIIAGAGHVSEIKSAEIWTKEGIQIGEGGANGEAKFAPAAAAQLIVGNIYIDPAGANKTHKVVFDSTNGNLTVAGNVGGSNNLFDEVIISGNVNANIIYGDLYTKELKLAAADHLVISTNQVQHTDVIIGDRNVDLGKITTGADGQGVITLGDATLNNSVKVKYTDNNAMANSLNTLEVLGSGATHELDLTGSKDFKVDAIEIKGGGNAKGEYAALVVKGGKLDLTKNGVNKTVTLFKGYDKLTLKTASEDIEFKAEGVTVAADNIGFFNIHAEANNKAEIKVDKIGNDLNNQLSQLHISSGEMVKDKDGKDTNQYTQGGTVNLTKSNGGVGAIFVKEIEIGKNEVIFKGEVNKGANAGKGLAVQGAGLIFVGDGSFSPTGQSEFKYIKTLNAGEGTFYHNDKNSLYGAIGEKDKYIKSFVVTNDFEVKQDIYANALTVNGTNKTIRFNDDKAARTVGGIDAEQEGNRIEVTKAGHKITGNVGEAKAFAELDIQADFEIGSAGATRKTVKITKTNFSANDPTLTLTNVKLTGAIDQNIGGTKATVKFDEGGEFKGSIGATNQLKALKFYGDDAKYALTFSKDNEFNAEILKSEGKKQELTFKKEEGDFTLPKIEANKENLKIVIGETKGNLTLEGIEVDYSKDDGVDGKVRKEYEPSLRIGAVADDINLSGDLYLKRLTVTAKDADQKLILQGKEYLIRKLSKTQNSDKEVILTNKGDMDVKFKEGTDIRSAEFLMTNDKIFTFEKNTKVGDILTDTDDQNTVNLYLGEESEFGNIGQAKKTVKVLNVTLVEDGVISEDIYVKNDVTITSEGTKKLVSFAGENLVADNIRYDGGNIEFVSKDDTTQKQKFNVTANGLIFNGKKVTFEHENGKKYNVNNINFKGEDNNLKLSDQDDINEIIFKSEGEENYITLAKDTVISKEFGESGSDIGINLDEHGLTVKDSKNVYGSIFSTFEGDDKKVQFEAGQYQVNGFGIEGLSLKRDVDLKAGTSVTVVKESYLSNITGQGDMTFKNDVSFEADSKIAGKELKFIAGDEQQNTVKIKGKVTSEYEEVSFKNQKLNLGHNHLDLGKGSVTIAGKIDMLLNYKDGTLGAIDGSGEFDSKALEKLNIILEGEVACDDNKEKSFWILPDNADISQDKLSKLQDDPAFETVRTLSFEKNKLNIKLGLNKKAIEEAQKIIKKYLDSEGTINYVEYLSKLYSDKKVGAEEFQFIQNICKDNEEERIEALNQIAESPKQSFDTSSVVMNQIQNMSSTMISSRMDNIRIAPEVADMGMVSAGEQDSSSNIGIWGAYSGGVGNMKEGEGSSKKEGDENKKGGDGSNFKISSSFHSVTVGLDAKINDSDDVIGLSFGYAKGSGTGKNFRDAEQIKLVSKNRIFSLYFMHNFNEEFSLDVSGSIIDGNIESTRLQRLTSGADGYKKLKGERPSFSYGAQVVGHYRCKMNDSFTLTPYGGLSFFNLTEKAYKEKAEKQEDNIDVVSSDVKEASSKKLGILLGVKANGLLDLGEGTKLIPEIHGGVNINLMDGVAKIESKIGAIKAEDGYNTVEGSKFSKFTGNLGFSGTVKTSNYISAGAGYDLDVAKGFLGHRGTLKLRIDF